MKIKLKRTPRCQGAEDDFCVWEVIVNGYVLGAWYGGKEKKYEDKYKWAEQQIAKRMRVLNKNIERLKKEVEELEKELKAISG